MPHGHDIKCTPKFEPLRLRRKVGAEHQEVGDAFVPFTLEVVFRHPQGVVALRVHLLRDGLGHSEALDEPFVGIEPIFRRRSVGPNVVQFDVTNVEGGEMLDHSFGLNMTSL